MSKESMEWYNLTNEVQTLLPQSEVPYDLAISYIKRVVKYINKNTKYRLWAEPKFSKAKANTKYCYFYTGRNGTWIIQTKGYGRWKHYSGWHNIIHSLAHKIIRNHTAEHSILEYKLSQFVKDWGYADNHIKTEIV